MTCTICGSPAGHCQTPFSTLIGPCGTAGCDCGHTIEELRKQNAIFREIIMLLMSTVEIDGSSEDIQKFYDAVESTLAKEQP